MQIIVNHFNELEKREIILKSLDLGKVFAVFCNVDCRYKDSKVE